MPTRSLPSNPSLDHLKNQARDLIALHRVGDLGALQRLREFHPSFSGKADVEIAASKLSVTGAQLAIAREHGFASWPRLKVFVEGGKAPSTSLPHHERIADPVFRRAVDLLDAGDVAGLRGHLRAHPDLVHQAVVFEGGNYFRNPKLLEFVAENPVRHDRLPPNVVDVARLILDAGAREDMKSINETLGLVCSGRVSREHCVQVPLIDLLCDYGADPNAGMGPALGHQELEAAQALLSRGARFGLEVAAALGQTEEATRLLPSSGADERHLAIVYAALFGRASIVSLLLGAGEDPNRYNPMGLHSHSTPLHQAAWAGHLDVVKVLVGGGAGLDIQDILFGATPLEWAEHGRREEVASYLRSQIQT